MPQWFARTGGILRQYFFASSMLCWRAPRMNGNGIHSPSHHERPHRKHVESHPCQGVKRASILVRRLQSGQVVANAFFAVAFGAWIWTPNSSVESDASLRCASFVTAHLQC
jgi:hypothetical protein